jgi:predicted transposase/invertase (TIGR01784 family)
MFNDRLEKEIDDWLYVMKYDDIPETFHSPYMQRVADKLNILKMTPEEREGYSYYLKQLYSDRDELQAAIAKGRREGREEERKKHEEERKKYKEEEKKKYEEERKNMVRMLLQEGMDIQKISRITGLPEEEIKSLELSGTK